MKGILLHGGHGTRLRPLTHTGPKQLLPIANKPMSQYCVEALKEAGITDIAIVIGGIGSSKVKEYYGTGKKFGLNFTYIEQDYPRGISHAISLCQNFVGNDKFVVFLGDNILKGGIKKYANEFDKSNADASILLCEVDDPSQFGIVEIQNGVIKKIVEKPKNPPSNLAVIGIYFLNSTIFDVIPKLKPSWRDELEITDALELLLEEEREVIVNTVTENWKDTGTPDDIIHANQFILETMVPFFLGEKEDGVLIDGKIMVGKNTVIKSGSKIFGPVILGENCIIESNSQIGPNVSIGNNSKIANCKIKNSIIMSDCIIDCTVSINNSIIALNSKIIANEKDDGKVFLLGEGTKIVF